MRNRILLIIIFSFNIIIIFHSNALADSTDNQNWRDFVYDKQAWELGTVNRLAVSGNHLFASGYFSKRFYDNTMFNGIAELQDSLWIPLGTGNNTGIRGGVFTNISDLLIIDNNLYVVGNFDTAGSINAKNIAKWNINSRTWSSVGRGTNGIIVSIVELNNKIIIGGRFDSLFTANDTIIAHNIAEWDGTNWNNLGNGINAPINAMYSSGNNLYVVGEFDTVGTTYSRHIGIWNDSTNQWSGVGNYGPDGVVFAVCKQGNSVFFGGYFDSVNTNNGVVIAKNITRWDGTSWYALDDGIEGHIHRLKTDGSNLYIAGSFEKIKNDSNFCKNIIMWNGIDWQFFGNGTNEGIRDLTFWGDSLLIGGEFMFTGETLAVNIGLWYEGELPGIINLPPNDGNILINAYPNPSKEEVIVDFYVDHKSAVKINIFDMRGNNREILVDGIYNEGWHNTTWNSSKYDIGIYFIDLNVGGKKTTAKMNVGR